MASVLGSKGYWIGAGVLAVIVVLAVLFWPQRGFIPERNEFMRIRHLPYDKERMNCIHKAILYSDYLSEKGWKNWVVVGKLAGYSTEHCWVIVLDEKGIRRLCDPTVGVVTPSGCSEDSYNEYKPRAYFDSGVDVKM